MSAGSATFRLLRDLQAAAETDTEVMNRERAETYLRVLAEAELRRASLGAMLSGPATAPG